MFNDPRDEKYRRSLLLENSPIKTTLTICYEITLNIPCKISFNIPFQKLLNIVQTSKIFFIKWPRNFVTMLNTYL